jgi:hypothetical protein
LQDRLTGDVLWIDHKNKSDGSGENNELDELEHHGDVLLQKTTYC